MKDNLPLILTVLTILLGLLLWIFCLIFVFIEYVTSEATTIKKKNVVTLYKIGVIILITLALFIALLYLYYRGLSYLERTNVDSFLEIPYFIVIGIFVVIATLFFLALFEGILEVIMHIMLSPFYLLKYLYDNFLKSDNKKRDKLKGRRD